MGWGAGCEEGGPTKGGCRVEAATPPLRAVAVPPLPAAPQPPHLRRRRRRRHVGRPRRGALPQHAPGRAGEVKRDGRRLAHRGAEALRDQQHRGCAAAAGGVHERPHAAERGWGRGRAGGWGEGKGGGGGATVRKP
jgi:hypothetical protein